MSRQCSMCINEIEEEAAVKSYEEFGAVYCDECKNKMSKKNNSTVDTYRSSKVELTTQSNFTREQIDTLKRTVAKDATDEEFQMLMYNSSKYGLDPFIKEIFFVKSVGIIASRDGYLKAAQRDTGFRGIDSMVVRENDDFEIGSALGDLYHKFGKGERGKIIGAWAKAKHAARDPVLVYVPFDEYNKNTPVWKQYPSAMIEKVAQVRALKFQFGLSGLVSKEEMGIEI